MIDIFSAFGLSSAAGFNAYLPRLIVGLLARFTSLIDLQSPWDALEYLWLLAILTVLLLVLLFLFFWRWRRRRKQRMRISGH